MIENELYPKLADASARAIQGLNPKITIWNTGKDGSGNKITDLAKTIPPLLTTIEEQTGLSLPDWLLKKNREPEDVSKIMRVLSENGIQGEELAKIIEAFRQPDVSNRAGTITPISF